MSQTGTVYGQSLYQLAKDEGLEEAVVAELSALETAFSEQPEFLKLLASHNLPKQERLEILDGSFRGKLQIYVLNFLKLLTEKGYITHFADCCDAYRAQYNADKGILQVRAVAAFDLTDGQKKKLTEKLSATTGKSIDLVCKVDKAVLGGVRLSYDGLLVDGTVQGRLAAMEKSLKNTVL